MEAKHEGLTIIIRRDLNEAEKEELIEIIRNYDYTPDESTLGFF